jgi:hypothetical protein
VLNVDGLVAVVSAITGHDERTTIMKDSKDVVHHIREEDDDFYSDDDLFSIKSWGADLSFRELIDRYKDGELVKPELQRKYVWDKSEASRFIDSLLLGLPVPSIFLAKTQDEKLLIVDGYQRIMTVNDYVRGIFSTDEKIFKLTRSDRINQRWRGRAFAELTEVEQRKIKNTTIHAIIFVQDKPVAGNTSLFQVFERINTSGRTLLPQEIRNCISQGKLNDLLFELNRMPQWREMFGLATEDIRMRDLEYILRFFALSSDAMRAETKEGISLKRFLNVYMDSKRNPTDAELEAFRTRFTKSVTRLYDAFGCSAFHNLSSTHPDKLVEMFNPTIFDSIMIATDYAISRNHAQLPADRENTRRILLRDDGYRAAITKETMRVASIRTRIGKAATTLFGITYE